MTLDQTIITVLRNARKDGLSLDEVLLRMHPVESAVGVAQVLAMLEHSGVVVSAIVDDNSPPGRERRIFHLRKEKQNAK